MKWYLKVLMMRYGYLNDNNMGTTKYEIKRKCENCGAVFIAKTIDSRFCSKKCSEQACKRRRAEEKRNAQLDAIADSIPDAREYITVPEAIAMFAIGRNTLYRLIHTGAIPSINLGERLTRINKEELMKIAATRKEVLSDNKPLPKRYSLEPEDCYTIGEISEKFHVNDSTVYAHIRRFSIPTRQIGNFVYVPKSEIDELYKSL